MKDIKPCPKAIARSNAANRTKWYALRHDESGQWLASCGQDLTNDTNHRWRGSSDQMHNMMRASDLALECRPVNLGIPNRRRPPTLERLGG